MKTIITGSRGVGKTTFLLKKIEKLKNKGSHPSGIMTPAIYNANGDKLGFYALNVADGEQWELGRSDKKYEGPSYGPFSFSEAGFKRANKILKKVLASGSEDVFLDEVGPLELEKSYGFYPIMSSINGFDINRNLYLVVRHELIDEFVDKFLVGKEYRIIKITVENRDEIMLLKK